jgi:hypothetical protein
MSACPGSITDASEHACVLGMRGGDPVQRTGRAR